MLSAGQASDKAAVEALIDGLPPAKALVADRGYDAPAVIDLVRSRSGCAHIPTQRDRKVQRSVPADRRRNLVERYFCKLKHFRRIATRFDKLARNFLAAVLLASSHLWLRDYASTTERGGGSCCSHSTTGSARCSSSPIPACPTSRSSAFQETTACWISSRRCDGFRTTSRRSVAIRQM